MTSAVRRPGGASHEAWFVDIEAPDGTTQPLFLRYDRGDPAVTGTPWTLHREAMVFLALQDTDVPVPRVLAVHEEHQAMLSERLVGENWFSRITDPGERVRTAQHFMQKLAALHRLDPHDLKIPAFPPPTTVADGIHHELEEWEHLIAVRGGEPDPALVFTIDWLRRNIPDPTGPVVLVQGDTGPGNFMYGGGAVVAVVDWELAHWGDPMDDIAWLSLRCTQEPFPDFPARLREYEELSGITIDESKVRYYRVMAEAKLQVMSHRPGGLAERFADSSGGGGDIGNGIIYTMLHRRLWLEAMATFVGLELTDPEPLPEHERADHDWLYDALLTQLRDVVVPRIADPLALARSKGFARVIKYLSAINDHGAAYREYELDDLTALLGSRPRSLNEGRKAIAEAARMGQLSDADYLRFLWRRVARDNELMRSASGVLADRHWPALR